MTRTARTALVAALLLMLTGCTPDATSATVARVIDGDTLVTTTDVRVRLLGIDTPEKGDCGASEATAAIRQLVARHEVQLVTDPLADSTDRYGRTLAYIEHDGVDVGRRLVADGWAAAWVPGSARTPVRTPAYLLAQAAAQKGQRGSWKACQAVGR